MSYNKQKLLYKKSPYVGKRQIRRRVVATVNDILSVITNNTGSTEKTLFKLVNNHTVKNDFSVEIINTCKTENIDAVNINTSNNDLSNCKTDFNFKYFYENLSTLDNNDLHDNNYTQLIETINCDELSLYTKNNNNLSIIENNFFHINNNLFNENLSDKNLTDKLKEWAVNGNVPHIRVTELLHLLQPFHPELPLSSKTLLNTPSIIKSKKLNNGEYYHFGLLTSLKRMLAEHDYSSNCKNVQLQINIDGLPLFKSCNTQLWPILCLLKNLNSSPFPIGIFCGTSKPDSLDFFLETFVNELEYVIQNSLEVKDKKYKVVLYNFVCDAPARAYLKYVKSHTGYSACDKCTIYGERVNNRIIFPNIRAIKRTDSSFRLQTDEDYHLGISPLTKVPIDLIKCFPIDYLHNICLGIMHKLLNTWISGQLLSVKLNSHSFKEISKHLQQLKVYVPLEINRKPRGLEDLARWKGTEYRTFLLYLGPIVLQY